MNVGTGEQRKEKWLKRTINVKNMGIFAKCGGENKDMMDTNQTHLQRHHTPERKLTFLGGYFKANTK